MPSTKPMRTLLPPWFPDDESQEVKNKHGCFRKRTEEWFFIHSKNILQRKEEKKPSLINSLSYMDLQTWKSYLRNTAFLDSYSISVKTRICISYCSPYHKLLAYFWTSKNEHTDLLKILTYDGMHFCYLQILCKVSWNSKRVDKPDGSHFRIVSWSNETSCRTTDGTPNS